MGSYVMIMKSFTLDRFLHLSSKKQANTMRIVPNVALAIAKSVNFDEFDLKAMKYILCSGATLPNDVIRVLHARLNEAPIFQGYG
jgi:4-coumarate--CoA ligase